MLAKLFASIVFGGFVGFLANFYLGLAKCGEPAKVVITVVVAVLVAVLAYNARVGVF